MNELFLKQKNDKLWAPWRIGYIQGKKQGKCLFCKAGKSVNDKDNFVINRSKSAFSLLNMYPYNNGHIMVSPYSHKKSLKQLSKNELLDIFKLINTNMLLLDKVVKPHGYNIGINIGRVSGAGIANHLHIHIVPRWIGDTNFMPVISNTKIISQSLEELYIKLNEANKRV